MASRPPKSGAQWAGGVDTVHVVHVTPARVPHSRGRLCGDRQECFRDAVSSIADRVEDGTPGTLYMTVSLRLWTWERIASSIPGSGERAVTTMLRATTTYLAMRTPRGGFGAGRARRRGSGQRWH